MWQALKNCNDDKTLTSYNGPQSTETVPATQCGRSATATGIMRTVNPCCLVWKTRQQTASAALTGFSFLIPFTVSQHSLKKQLSIFGSTWVVIKKLFEKNLVGCWRSIGERFFGVVSQMPCEENCYEQSWRFRTVITACVWSQKLNLSLDDDYYYNHIRL